LVNVYHQLSHYQRMTARPRQFTNVHHTTQASPGVDPDAGSPILVPESFTPPDCSRRMFQ